jgi:hypothetical protein
LPTLRVDQKPLLFQICFFHSTVSNYQTFSNFCYFCFVFITVRFQVRDENTEELLRHFLFKEIGIDFRIDFGNVHRFSHKPRGKRPIVARFIHFNDLQYVLNNAYRLRNTPYGIRQQFPREIEDRHRELYPIQKEAKRQGKRVALIRDRLYIETKQRV